MPSGECSDALVGVGLACSGLGSLLIAAIAGNSVLVMTFGAAALLLTVFAGLVLLPEGLAAVKAVRADRLQTSLNLALGSALATIGLTIPAVAAVSIIIDQPIQLGLDLKGQEMLALTLLLSVITLGTSRTTVLQGTVHLDMFAVFLFFAVVP
jgi:Ca2+:H+ antiporter